MTWSDSGECCAGARSASLPWNRMLRDPQPFTMSCKQTCTTCAPAGDTVQGSPTPGPQTSAIRNWAAPQEASGEQQVKLHLLFPCHSPLLPLPPEQSSHSLSVENFSAMKQIPDAKKLGVHWSRQFTVLLPQQFLF